MHVVCYGAGAIGSLVGGRLARTGVPTVLVGRQDHVDAINRDGLTVLEPGAPPRRVTPRAYTSLAAAIKDKFSPRLAILTVKGYDTARAAADLAANLPSRAQVLTLQNGIGNEELIAAVLGPERTASGCITISAGLPGPGRVQLYTTHGGVGLAPFTKGASANPLAVLLAEAGFTTQVCADWRGMKWSKLLLNILGNAVSAIVDLPPGEIFADPALCGLEKAAFLEALAVMRGRGLRAVNLPGYPVRLMVSLFRTLPPAALSRLLAGRLGGGRGEKMPSLWLDLQKGRTASEITFLNGAVAEEGRKLGLPTPANSRIADTLAGLFADPSRREKYRHNPAALLEAHATM